MEQAVRLRARSGAAGGVEARPSGSTDEDVVTGSLPGDGPAKLVAPATAARSGRDPSG